MKKINETQAIELINQGFFPKCYVARIMKPIRSKSELEHLQRLASVQPYTLYGFSNAEISRFKNLEDDVISISLDEAIEMLSIGEEVYAKVLGEKEIYNFLSANSLIDFYKKNSINGNSVLFYWKE